MNEELLRQEYSRSYEKPRNILEDQIVEEESQEKVGQGSLNLSIQDEEILRRKHRQDC